MPLEKTRSCLPSSVTLTPAQEQAESLILRGQSVVLQGPTHSGKRFLIRHVSTSLASLNIGIQAGSPFDALRRTPFKRRTVRVITHHTAESKELGEAAAAWRLKWNQQIVWVVDDDISPPVVLRGVPTVSFSRRPHADRQMEELAASDWSAMTMDALAARDCNIVTISEAIHTRRLLVVDVDPQMPRIQRVTSEVDPLFTRDGKNGQLRVPHVLLDDVRHEDDAFGFLVYDEPTLESFFPHFHCLTQEPRAMGRLWRLASGEIAISSDFRRVVSRERLLPAAPRECRWRAALSDDDRPPPRFAMLRIGQKVLFRNVPSVIVDFATAPPSRRQKRVACRFAADSLWPVVQSLSAVSSRHSIVVLPKELSVRANGIAMKGVRLPLEPVGLLADATSMAQGNWEKAFSDVGKRSWAAGVGILMSSFRGPRSNARLCAVLRRCPSVRRVAFVFGGESHSRPLLASRELRHCVRR